MRQVFIGAFMLLVATSAFGQHFIKGKVLDQNGSALTGATVVIQHISRGEISRRDGTFIFDGLSKGHYVLEISFVGFENAIVRTDVDKEIVVTLNPASYSISEITVSSLRATDRSAVTYSNVSSKDIGERNLGQDIPYLLALTPSFVATSDAGTGIGYTGFRIRGTDANRVNITVNGIPLNDSESHGVYFVNMPDFASSLSSVQVQRGVGTSTNGAAAFGASINMQTENINTIPYAEVSTTLGSFNSNKYSVKAGTGILKSKLAFDARVSGVNANGYVDRAFADMKSYFVSGGYYGNKTILKLVSFGGKEKTYQAWNGVDMDMVRLDPLKYKRTYNEIGKYTDDAGNIKFYDNQTDNYTQTHYQLHWMQILSDAWKVNAAVHYTNGLGYYEDYKEARKYKEYMLTPATEGGVTLKKTDLIRQKWLDNDFFGLTFALNYQKADIVASLGGGINRYNGEHYGKILWVRKPNNFDPSKDWYRNTGVKDDANIYAKANAGLSKKLVASVDLQYRYIQYDIKGNDDKYDDKNLVMRDITQNHVYHFFNPKLGLTYKIDKQNDLYTSYSIANREPNRSNYTDAGINDLPKSERLTDIELGYRFQSPLASGGVNVYYMKYKNQLILTGKVSEIGEPLTSNIDNSYRTGIELIAGIKLSDNFSWNGNMTVSKNVIKSFVEVLEAYDADWNKIEPLNINLGTTSIAYSPNVIANSIFKYKLNAFEASVHTSYVGKQFIDNTSSDSRSIDAYLVSNLQLGYSLKTNNMKSIDFNLLINNIFNEEYESNGYNWWTYSLGGVRFNEKRYFPQAGTNFLASVTLKF